MFEYFFKKLTPLLLFDLYNYFNNKLYGKTIVIHTTPTLCLKYTASKQYKKYRLH